MKEETFPCPFWTTSKKCSAKKSDSFHNSRTLSKCFSAFNVFPAGLTEKTIESFNHFWTLSEKFSPFCQKSWSRAARTAFYVFTGTFWKIYFPEKSLKFLFTFSDTERKCFGFLSFFFNEIVNSVFYVSMETLQWKIFSKNVFRFSFLLRTLTGTKFWGEFFEKNFSLSFFIKEHNFFCCKNCILRVPRYILTKDFFEENVYFFQFRFLSKHFQLFVRILRTGLSKLKST